MLKRAIQNLSSNWKLSIIIGCVGVALLITQLLFLKYYPVYQEMRFTALSEGVPYEDSDLGIRMKIADGLYGEIETIPGGVRIRNNRLWRIGPSILITSRPNPDRSDKFSPTLIAKWQTRGVYEEIPEYAFAHLAINDHDAVIIRMLQGRNMHMLGRIISEERIVEIDCTPGQEDEITYMKLCNQTIRSVKMMEDEEETGDVMEFQPTTARIEPETEGGGESP